LKPLLVLCLGNDILSDDSFGPAVAKRLESNGLNYGHVEVVFAPTAGFGLLDLLKDRRSVLIVDAIVTGRAVPGTVHFFEAGALTPSYNLINSHQINLPTALELGKQLQMAMPSDIQVVAVEAQDVETIGEQMTPPVAGAVETAVTAVRNWVESKCAKMSSN
jgi:hydrogenase maturation protease